MKTTKKLLKNKWFYYIVLFTIIIPATFYYTVFTVYSYIEKRDAEIFNTGWENGYMAGQEYQEGLLSEEKLKQIKAHRELVLKELAKIESRGGEVRKLLDTNNKYSLGLYHFQAATVKDMYKRYYKKHITIEEAVAIAQDDELATELAYHAIFVRGELSHWHNSMIKLNRKGLVAYGTR